MIILLYGSISILIISLSGLSIIFLLPYFHNDQQSNLSQFFVGLAIGTLCSDALLHLLPHVRQLVFLLNFTIIKKKYFFYRHFLHNPIIILKMNHFMIKNQNFIPKVAIVMLIRFGLVF